MCNELETHDKSAHNDKDQNVNFLQNFQSVDVGILG